MGGEGRGMLPPVKNEMTAAAKGGKAEEVQYSVKVLQYSKQNC